MRPAGCSEKGSISIITAIFALALFGLLASLITHGQFLNSHAKAREAATNAARVGAQEIDIQHFLDTGERELDTGAAEQAIRNHTANYDGLTITNLDVTRTGIEVTISETITAVTGITKTISSTGRAIPLPDR